MTHRHLKLSHEEIEIIKDALNYFYFSKSELIKNNSNLITPEERETLLLDANKYNDLSLQINNDEKDV